MTEPNIHTSSQAAKAGDRLAYLLNVLNLPATDDPVLNLDPVHNLDEASRILYDLSRYVDYELRIRLPRPGVTTTQPF